jgi:hypothetical protein
MSVQSYPFSPFVARDPGMSVSMNTPTVFPPDFRMKNPENIIHGGFVYQLAGNRRHFSAITRFICAWPGKGSRFLAKAAVQNKYRVGIGFHQDLRVFSGKRLAVSVSKHDD